MSEEMTEVVEKEDLGINEITELIEAVKIVAISGKRIAKNGIDASDLTEVFALFNQFPKLQKGFTGLKDFMAQARDIREGEAIVVGTMLYNAIKEIKEA